MNYELIALAVTILAAMGAGFTWLSHQVRDEHKTDIKRVEAKLDNKEKELRQEFRSDFEKIIAQACENLGNSIKQDASTFTPLKRISVLPSIN